MPKPVGLIGRVREVVRYKHYSIRIGQAYVQWIVCREWFLQPPLGGDSSGTGFGRFVPVHHPAIGLIVC